MARMPASVPNVGRPIGWLGKGGFLEAIEDDVVRRVVRLADLLQDDAPLPLQLLGQEGAVRQDVADDVGAQGQVFLQQLDVIGRLLPRGIGVDVAADVLDFLGDLRGAAPGRAL